MTSNLHFVEYIRSCGDMLAITFRDCDAYRGMWADREITPHYSRLSFESSKKIPSGFECNYQSNLNSFRVNYNERSPIESDSLLLSGNKIKIPLRIDLEQYRAVYRDDCLKDQKNPREKEMKAYLKQIGQSSHLDYPM